ncbi:MAG TPA: fibronectin type III domain-containing protein, partial [Elusimicrobiota bacterium]|nr:fibronectin type III domain-containing protein [Elusimicrobiota bacterium]
MKKGLAGHIGGILILALLFSPMTAWGKGTVRLTTTANGDGTVTRKANGASATKVTGASYLEIGSNPSPRAECDGSPNTDGGLGDDIDYNDDGVLDGPCSTVNRYHGRTVSFAEWDITSLPSNATLLNVWVNYSAQESSSTFQFQFKDMSLQPTNLANTADQLLTDIEGGTAFSGSTNVPSGAFPFPSTFTLNSTARADLSAIVSAQSVTWWALGMATSAAGTAPSVYASAPRNIINSYDAGQSPVPTLVVEYSTPPTPATSLTGIAVGATSITWRFMDNAAGFSEDTGTYLQDGSETILVDMGVQPGAGLVTQSVLPLTPNTQYTMHIHQYNEAGASSSTARSTWTYAAQPTNTTVLEVYATSATISWNANDNPNGTPYLVQVTTDPGGNFSAFITTTSTTTTNPSGGVVTFQVAGLIPNTDNYIRVRARNAATPSVPTPFDATVMATPGVASPGLAAFGAIGTFNITAQWTPGGNPYPADNVYYQAQRASDANFTVINDTQPASPTANTLSANFEGLQRNTTYWFRVRAFDASMIASSWLVLGGTMTAVSPVTSPIHEAVHQTSMSFKWSDLNNTINSPISYRVELSSVSFASGVIFSSATTSAATPSTTITSTVSAPALVPNTTYYARIFALNSIGAPSAQTNVDSPRGWATNPVPADTFELDGTPWEDFINVKWSNNVGLNNSLLTRYRIDASTDSNFSVYTSTSVSPTWVPPASPVYAGSVSSLFSNTTYYLRIIATGYNGTNSEPLYITTTTRPRPPTSPVITEVGITSVTVSWQSNNNGPNTVYRVQASSEPGYTVFDTSYTVNTWATFLNLSTNTAHQFRVDVVTIHGDTPTFINESTSTLANIPANVANPYSNMAATSLRVSWNTNTNPSGTNYLVEATSNTTGLFDGNAPIQGATVTTTYRDFSTLPNTIYYFRVLAINDDAIKTDFLTIGSTVSRAAQPSITGFTNTSTSLTPVWSTNNNPADTQYFIENATNAHNSGWTTNNFWQDTALSTNTGYAFQVKARSRDGVETAYSVKWTTRTLAAVPPMPTVSNGAGSRYALDISFSPGTNPPGDPNATQFAVQVLDGSEEPSHLYMYLNSPYGGTPNEFLLDGSSTNPPSTIWKTLAEWNNGVIVATGLVSGRDYTFGILARNGNSGAIIPSLPNSGIPTAPSLGNNAMTGSGAPAIYLDSRGYRHDDGLEHWFNGSVVPFTAKGSFHYHYKFTQNTSSNADDLTEPGWNGKISTQTGTNLANDLSDGEPTQSSTQPVSGFKATSEGQWVLYVLGDAYLAAPPLADGLPHPNPQFPAQFFLKLDLSSPTVTLKAQYAAGNPYPIENGVGSADSTPYFYWDEPANGTVGAISPIVGYAVSFSSNVADNPPMSQTAPEWIGNTRNYQVPTPQPYGTYFFKVRALDTAGNWTDPPAEFEYVHNPDTQLPVIVNVNMGVTIIIPGSNVYVSVSVNVVVNVTFSEAM